MNKQLVGISLSICLAAYVLAGAAGVHAQEVTNLPRDAQHAIGLDLGLDNALVSRFAYGHRLRSDFQGGDLLLQAALTIPLAETDIADSRLDVGMRATALAYENLRLQVGLAGVLTNTTNDAFAANALGLGIVIMPGYQSEAWGLMAELGYEKVLATHLRPSDLYLARGYGGARSGWYSSTAGNVRAGLRGGARLGRVELNARAGVTASEEGERRLPPFYGTLGVAYAF